jgi:hypothetical protein
VGRDGERLVHVLLDQQNRNAALVDPADDGEIVLHQARRQAERRLVDQQQFWRAHQAAADRHHRLLAARHGAGQLAAALAKPGKDAKDFGDAAADRHLRSIAIGADAQILLDCELGKNFAALGNAGNAGGNDPVRGQPGDIDAAKGDAAGARRRQAEDGADQGGLAGTVGA